MRKNGKKYKIKLSEIKEILPTLENVEFKLEDVTLVPEHFYVIEVGQITKKITDCNGAIRTEKVVNFQLWDVDDYEHLLKPSKLSHIIQLYEDKLGIENAEIEVEYQSKTIGKYDLDFDGKHFVLTNKQTNKQTNSLFSRRCLWNSLSKNKNIFKPIRK